MKFIAYYYGRVLVTETTVPGKRALVCPALDCWPEPRSEEQGRADSQQGSSESLRKLGGGQGGKCRIRQEARSKEGHGAECC